MQTKIWAKSENDVSYFPNKPFETCRTLSWFSDLLVGHNCNYKIMHRILFQKKQTKRKIGAD